MLTADLVRASKRKGELVVKPLAGKTRERALELAEAYLAITEEHVGRAREELREACAAVPIQGREKKLSEGLLKLIDDACEFTAEGPIDPRLLRSDLFLRAADARRRDAFDRDAILAALATQHETSPERIEQAVYSDLRNAHVLERFSRTAPEVLIERYDRAQLQAVLLRAERLTAVVWFASPLGYRMLLRQLKFRRLLYRVERREGGGFRIEIDGPYSLFESVTRYGLQLALALPALQAADYLRLEASLRWGKGRDRLRFCLEEGLEGKARAAEHDGDGSELVVDEVARLVEGFRTLRSGWSVHVANEILDLPGVGVCVPDLVFEKGGRKVFFEALGFWSRDAVWKRVELARRGLPVPVLFAASSRLRVSEKVLAGVEDACLYVYKGALSPRAVERHLEALGA